MRYKIVALASMDKGRDTLEMQTHPSSLGNTMNTGVFWVQMWPKDIVMLVEVN